PVWVAPPGVRAGPRPAGGGAPGVRISGRGALAAGCLGWSALPTSLGVAGYVAPLVVITAGYALFQTANNTAVMADVPPDRRGVVSGLLNLSRNLGLVTGASALGAIFALAAGASDVATAPPAAGA